MKNRGLELYESGKHLSDSSKYLNTTWGRGWKPLFAFFHVKRISSIVQDNFAVLLGAQLSLGPRRKESVKQKLWAKPSY